MQSPPASESMVAERPAHAAQVDESARAFCAALIPALVGAIQLHCGRRDIAEELAHDVVVRVLAKWPRIRSQPNPRAYVFRMGLNASASWHRRRAAERRAHGRMDRPDDGEPDNAAKVAVRDAVAALPAKQRAVLILRYYLDLPVDDVARALGCAPGTVKAHTFKALAALRVSGLLDEDLS